jgi:hypothetical protein
MIYKSIINYNCFARAKTRLNLPLKNKTKKHKNNNQLSDALGFDSIVRV